MVGIHAKMKKMHGLCNNLNKPEKANTVETIGNCPKTMENCQNTAKKGSPAKEWGKGAKITTL